MLREDAPCRIGSEYTYSTTDISDASLSMSCSTYTVRSSYTHQQAAC